MSSVSSLMSICILRCSFGSNCGSAAAAAAASPGAHAAPWDYTLHDSPLSGMLPRVYTNNTGECTQ